MAQAEDLDNTLDGFDPEETYGRYPRRGRSNYKPTYTQPITTTTTLPPPVQATHVEAEPTHSQAPAPQAQSKPDPIKEEPKAPVSEATRAPREKRPNPIISFLTSDGLRIFLGVFLILSCVFVLIALVSHFHASVHDQSLVMNSSLSEMAASGKVQNLGGSFGAKLAHLFLCDALGLGSIVLVLYAWLLAMGLLGFKKCYFWSLTFKCLLVSITISVVLGLVTYQSDSAIKWGGTHGYYVNKLLHDYATWIGAAGVSLLLIAAVACVYINELRHAWSRWRETVNRRRLQEQLRRERERTPEDAIEAANANESKVDGQVSDDAASEGAAAEKQSIEMTLSEEEENARPIAEGFSLSSETDTTQKVGRELLDIADYEDGGFTIDDFVSSDDSTTKANDENFNENVEENGNGGVEESIDESINEKVDNIIGNLISNTEEEAASEVEQPTDNVVEAETQDPVEAVNLEAEPAEEQFTVNATEIEQADEIDTPEPDPRELGPYDHRAELSHYKFPDIELLIERKSGTAIDMEEQQANKDLIVKTLSDYKIPIIRIEATVGPTITLYEVVPAEGVRIAQIKRLEDDIAMSLAALGIRIIAPIPGKGTVGIEVPNRDPQTVSMRSVIASKKFQECKMALPMAMGATISNDIFIADMAKMPHMLVAGATGQGKSVGLNAIIASMLYKKHPSELKFVLIDPKQLEFSLYEKLERHFLAKLPDEDDAIITDMQKVILTLNSLCVEMDNRYTLMRLASVRTVEEYNAKFAQRALSPANGHKYLPYIVVIIDEFADLIMTAGKEVEMPIARIAQKARAAGIHMIIATQRPSTNVITGLIKANFPGRIAFRVAQMVDSRTILDSPGANRLIGRGDMLFSHNGTMTRVQCAFCSTEEVEAIVKSIDEQVGFEHAYYLPEPQVEGSDGAAPAGGNVGDRDALFDEAARFVVQRQLGSTSSLQRQFNIGYNRAGRLMDQMEAAGIIGPVNGSKPRAILVDSIALETILEG